MLRLSVAKEFTATPGPRRREEGDFSGQEFLEDLLRPKFLEARGSGMRLLVDLDGTAGYPTSFLEEAFGGLAREFTADDVLRVLEFRSTEEPFLLDEVREYIASAT